MQVFVTERAGHARELARAAIGRGVRLVLAWGGDGTINEAASALAFGPVPLGIVPGGSGNGLAHQLGVDRRAEHAIADALRAEPRLIDLGEVDGRLFANVAGVGIDAYVAAGFDRDASGRRGLLTYMRISGRALVTYAPSRYTIVASGFTRDVRAVVVSIANSAEMGNGALIAPGARVDDGLLDLVVIEERSRLRTVGQVPRLFTGTVAKIPGCTILRIEQATIDCDEPMVYHVDGEPVAGGTSLHVRVHPRALRVCTR
jgi:diacylglycerol kinase (ATP)